MSLKEGRRPVYAISDGKVSLIKGADGYRLPTEAEWEFACRGGTTGPWYFDDLTAQLGAELIADQGQPGIHERRSKFTDRFDRWNFHWSYAQNLTRMAPNPFGLHRMYCGSLEQCWDWASDYDRSQPQDLFVIDPLGAASGKSHVTRGGSAHGPSLGSCNSVARGLLMPPEQSGNYAGFGRVVLSVESVREQLRHDAAPQSAAVAPPWQPNAEQQAFFDDVAKLDGLKAQAAAVEQQLRELNPEYAGTIETKIMDGRVKGITFKGRPIVTLWPVRAFPDLVAISLPHVGPTQLNDLSCLAGLRLEDLHCPYCAVSDLTPITGMPLQHLALHETNVRDLTPLSEMSLETLSLIGTQVADLSPLRNMPLRKLRCGGNPALTDLSPLASLPLEELFCSRTGVTDLSPLAGLPLKILSMREAPWSNYSQVQHLRLEVLGYDVRLFHEADDALLNIPGLRLVAEEADSLPADEFFKNVAARRQEMLAFAAEVAKLPVENQPPAIVQKMKEQNHEQFGSRDLDPVIDQGAVTEVTMRLNGRSRDVTPLIGLAGLRKLTIELNPAMADKPFWIDLSVLTRLPLEELTCRDDMLVKNLPLLREHPTLKLINGKAAGDYLANLTGH
ncbi:MAG: hypothetical protein B7Z55_08135 [Planctomycetales bacterium 12-60-4]|nr:MAG: hypothetical protein B7Z55_08135 [Planctomycetales bacterium 12-60-4]